MPSTYTRIVLRERPTGDIVPNVTFRAERVPFKFDLSANHVLVQVTWLSLDPAMRGYLNDTRSYMAPVQIGETMRAHGLAVVIQTGFGSAFEVGQTVTGAFGWTEYAVVKDKDIQKLVVPPGAESLDFLNALGPSGMTAYFGLTDICAIKPGEVLVVSGAAGSVGALTCQLGRKMGAKVYAIAGSQEKCEWLEKDLGVEKAFNYKSPDFRKDFRKIGYVDVFFDNVGGDILDMVLAQLRKNARIALCGAISQYNTRKARGLQNYLALISQRAKIQGFLVFDYVDRWPEAVEQISKGLADGSIKQKFHVVEGLEQAPTALLMLFDGGNTGKLVLKVSDGPKANL